MIPFPKIHWVTGYRLRHEQGINELKKMCLSRQYIPTQVFIIKEQNDGPQTDYQVVDGTHRWFAATSIIASHGLDYFERLTNQSGSCLQHPSLGYSRRNVYSVGSRSQQSVRRGHTNDIHG